MAAANGHFIPQEHRADRHHAASKPVEAVKESWWLNPATFYTKARERFPETGAAIVERGKVAITAKDSNGGRERRTA